MEREIVEQIKKISSVKSCFENEKCKSLDFTDPANVYWGVFRHSKNKKEIIGLVNKLKNLEYLNLRKNKLEFCFDLDLPNLTYLDLGSNYISNIPNCIRGLKLKYLNLGVNQIKNIPFWFADYELETLKLHKNSINELPILNKKIKILNLYQNKFENIPDQIWKMNELEYFAWGFGNTTEMPEGVGNLNNLKYFLFVISEVRVLPKTFSNLVKLRGITLCKNKLEKIPDYFETFVDLENISLYKNKIKQNPMNILKKLPKLKSINIEKNLF